MKVALAFLGFILGVALTIGALLWWLGMPPHAIAPVVIGCMLFQAVGLLVLLALSVPRGPLG